MFNLIRKTLLLSLVFVVNVHAQFNGPAPVKVAKVQEFMMAPIRKIPASVQAKFISTIKAESKGIVNSLVDVGSFVEHGEALAELSDTQAALREQELNNAVSSASARFDFLKSENARLKDLVGKNLISNSELEQNQSDYLAAKGNLAQVQSRFDQYIDQVTKLTIYAPFDGHVMQQHAQPGQLLNFGDSVIEFMQAGNLEVVVNVPYKYKSQINNQAIWDVQTEEGRIIKAPISRFIPAATGMSHTVEVHLAVNDEDIWSGEAVTVFVPKQEKTQVMAIPRDALVIRGSGTFVYTVVENKAHKIDVKVGMAQGDLIEITGKLSLDDVVITRGNERLRPQAVVRVIN